MSRLEALESRLISEGTLTPIEQWGLVEIARYYRRMLAMKTAEYAYLDMKNFAQIDVELRPLGYRLVKMANSRIPVLEEIKL